MSLRVGLWRLWLVAAAVWTIAVFWLRWPYLAGDCLYFANCYPPDSMWYPALALLLLPPPLIFVLGYWIVRGFRSDYGRINWRIALGVALMPVWVFIAEMNIVAWRVRPEEQPVGRPYS